MPDNEELKFQLTDADREKLKDNSAFSLPDNPSDKEFSADQIKKAMYYPSLMLFDWMKEGFDSYDAKFDEFDIKLGNKVDKIDNAKIIYGTDSSKTNIGIQYSVDALADNIVQRNNLGEVNVPASTTNDYAAISRLQFRLEIARLDDEDVKKAGSTMSGNLKFNNGFGLYDRNNKILISQLNDVNTVGNVDASLELKGSSIRTVDKTLKKYNSSTGTSEDYALIGDVNTEKARAMAEEADIRNIAAGKSKTISISIVDNPDFDTEALELSYIGTIKDVDGVVYNQTQLKKGDEILIVETGKKDRWFGGTGKFYVLESDTSFLVNYQKKLFPDSTITLDALGNIKANITFALLSGAVSDNVPLSNEFATKQNKTTSYNFNADSSKTVFYQPAAPIHAPTGALWMSPSAGISVSFDKIMGSIKDNVTSDGYIKGLIQSKVNRGVLTSLEPIYSGDLFQLKFTSVNLWEQTSVNNTINIPLANPTTAGLMSYEDYNTLIANTQKIAQLEGRLQRIYYELKDHPTASEIDSYVRGLGYTVDDFPYLKVIVYSTKHMWLYYTKPTARWQDDGIDSASLFTNATAGLIKGAATEGKVFAESDGTGSVFGWDALKTRVTNSESAITTIQADLPNYIQKTGGTFTGNINMGGHLINMVGGRIANIAIGGDDDAVPKKWITAQLGNYLPKVGGTIDGDLVITGTLSIGTFELSGDLDAKTHKITNLGTPTSANDAATKDYVDIAIDDLDDLLSDEVDARIKADDDMMTVKNVAPTSSSEGALGQMWKNTLTGKIYICSEKTGSTYVWKELGSNDNVATLNTEQIFTAKKTFNEDILLKSKLKVEGLGTFADATFTGSVTVPTPTSSSGETTVVNKGWAQHKFHHGDTEPTTNLEVGDYWSDETDDDNFASFDAENTFTELNKFNAGIKLPYLYSGAYKLNLPTVEQDETLAIRSDLDSYYTKTQIDTKFGDYYTKTESDDTFATQTSLDDYLEKSGGQLTGSIIHADDASTVVIKGANDSTNYPIAYGGTDYNGGASLWLAGKGAGGGFGIDAYDGTNRASLVGNAANGELKWNNEKVLTQRTSLPVLTLEDSSKWQLWSAVYSLGSNTYFMSITIKNISGSAQGSLDYPVVKINGIANDCCLSTACFEAPDLVIGAVIQTRSGGTDKVLKLRTNGAKIPNGAYIPICGVFRWTAS